MSLVIVGGATDRHVEQALRAFEEEGWTRAGELSPMEGADSVMGARDAGTLRAADAMSIRYRLVHHGPDDGVPDGTYERAHFRVESAELHELARRLRARDPMLVTCLAFGFKDGIPQESGWVIDTRLLDNPYWEPHLRPLDGRHPQVREYVLRQPAAAMLLDGLEATLGPLLAEYRRRGRSELTIAFGCTGGRHRSVVLAEEMARRLRGADGIEVEFQARDLASPP